VTTDSSVSTDPLERFVSWFEEAQACSAYADVVALATAGVDSTPSVRFVNFKGMRNGALMFYTNYGSRKARELTGNPRAALCQHWPTLEEQVRVEGRVEVVDPQESDRYFASRPRDSQLGAWASDQSQPMESRDVLAARLREVEPRFEGRAVDRPPFWGGFRVIPDRMEFWFGRPGRLHERLLYAKTASGWSTSWLFP